jgi:hypothetical protein
MLIEILTGNRFQTSCVGSGVAMLVAKRIAGSAPAA